MGQRPWTPEEEALIGRLVGGRSYADIARHLPGRTPDSVRSYVRRRGLMRPNGAVAPPTEPAAIQPASLLDLERLAAKLHAEGHDFRVEDGKVIPLTLPQAVDREVTIDLGKDHYRLGVVSDTHGGSFHEQISALRSFYRYADDLGVDAFIHGGDWVQGSDKMHRDQPYSVHCHGAEQQVGYVVASYPRSRRPDILTYGISGNHDASFLADGGVNVFRMIASQRDDIVYVGQDAAYLTFGGLKVYLVHPDGGNTYAKSYRSQRLATALPIGRAVNLMLVGHLHSFDWVEEHGIESVLLPCFQSQYGWLARKGLHPAIGGLILDVWLTDAGEVARMTIERVRYQAQEDDWDHEASASVAHGWSPKGLAA